MLNNFCFHVYAEKSLFIAENCNGFFLTPSAREFGTHRAGSQLKIIKEIFKRGRHGTKTLSAILTENMGASKSVRVRTSE